jgi:hypothetical protein
MQHAIMPYRAGERGKGEARLLLAKDLDTLLNGLLRLLTGRSLGATEDELGNQAPFSGDVPLLGDGGVDEGVVVLQVCAEAEGFEAGPDWWGCLLAGFWNMLMLKEGDLTEVLVHGVGVLSPGLEVSLVSGELLLEGLDVGGIFVEEDLYMQG